MRLYLVGTAGVILAVFLMGCGKPSYHLDGVTQVRQVSLLDNAVQVAVDSVHVEFKHLIDFIALAEVVAVDSMTKSASSMGPTIRVAQRNLKAIREKYLQTFRQMQQFRSFGGNPVFTDDDVGVKTSKLLSEIPARFYKGRAFSLETEGKIRNFIRQELIPLEGQVKTTQNRVSRLQNSRAGRTNAKATIAEEYRQKREELLQATNQDVQRVIRRYQLEVENVDSLGHFAFDGVAPGQYHLFGGDTDSVDFLVPVRVSAHTWQDFSTQVGMPIFVSLPSDSTQPQ